MKNIKKLINAIIGRSHIEDRLIKSKSPFLLHVSDTPSQFYPELNRIIKLINPEFIIHTGDLADDIKTEFSPSLNKKYQYEVGKLLEILNASKTKNIHLAMGNHDDFDFISQNKGKLKIYDSLGEVDINGNKILFSHFSDLIKEKEADIFMFGHSLEVGTEITESGIYLNGITAMHIINLETLDIHFLKYPFGTDPARMNYNKIRI